MSALALRRLQKQMQTTAATRPFKTYLISIISALVKSVSSLWAKSEFYEIGWAEFGVESEFG